MTKSEAIRQTAQENTLINLGFTSAEAESLRRISMTLHRWHEGECGLGNGCIERDEDTGKAFWFNATNSQRYAISDRETGARKRLNAILKARNDRQAGVFSAVAVEDRPRTVTAYVQGDPRGASLYILRPGDVPEGASVDGYYSRGICVY